MVGERESLPLRALQAKVTVDGFRARVVLDYLYENDRSQGLEGTFQLRLPALGEGTAYVLGMGADRARVTRGPPTLSASRPARLLPQPPALPWRLCH